LHAAQIGENAAILRIVVAEAGCRPPALNSPPDCGARIDDTQLVFKLTDVELDCAVFSSPALLLNPAAFAMVEKTAKPLRSIALASGWQPICFMMFLI
jgi:hypothetical protein